MGRPRTWDRSTHQPDAPSFPGLLTLEQTRRGRVQASQARAAQRLQDRAHREALYSEFIQEASRLFVDAFEHELEDPAKLVHLYAIVSTIRLFGNPATLLEAEKVMTQIGATYFAPNKDVRLFAEIAPAGDLDPLFAFSKACRDELQIARS
jgi:hypothetical protein